MKKTILLPAFILMVLVQLYIPVRLVIQSENILSTGKAYKFRTASVYPLSPVNGNMIILNFSGTTAHVENTAEWEQNQPVFVALSVDSSGFAAIDFISKTVPEGDVDYVKAFIDFINADSTSSVLIRYPFDRFYLEATMDKSGRPLVFEPSYADSTAVTYAYVIVKAGDAIVEDVLVNEKSIKNTRDDQE
jgi:uncharacterized membrane-anchored protein